MTKRFFVSRGFLYMFKSMLCPTATQSMITWLIDSRLTSQVSQKGS